MKYIGKSLKPEAKSNVKRNDRISDRKSATGIDGSPKKGGRGGKFTWAGDGGYSQAEIGFHKEAFDVKDPSFEDPEEIVTA